MYTRVSRLHWHFLERKIFRGAFYVLHLSAYVSQAITLGYLKSVSNHLLALLFSIWDVVIMTICNPKTDSEIERDLLKKNLQPNFKKVKRNILG